MRINYEELVHRADLYYDGTAERCEEGLPIGNGRMGSLIWTSPNAMKLQINRTDVFANGPDTESFPAEHRDYGYACALFDLDFVGYGPDVFDDTTKQHLDCYNAVAHINSHGINIDGFASTNDTFVFKIIDDRDKPTECAAKLKFLRAAAVETREKHHAKSYFHRVGDVIVLRQVFEEKKYFCSSAVAVRITGRDYISRINDENNGTRQILPEGMCGFGASTEFDMRLCMPAQKGEYCCYISSSATFDRDFDIIKDVVDKVKTDSETGYDKLLKDHILDWNRFWTKSYIKLSGFKEAEMLETHYQYFMYIMNSISKNTPFAPNFGGLLFSPRGDLRHWGAMQWFNNITLTYNSILPSGHYELIDPYLDMYFNIRDRLSIAAKQHFGADGIYVFETTHVLGPEPLPEEFVEEFRNFMLDRGPETFNECSPELQKYGYSKPTLESRWDFLNPALADSRRPYAWCTHLFDSAGHLAYHFYMKYVYTGDIDYLRNKAYPMIKGVCEFYRTYPNTTKEVYPKYPDVADGKYHIYGTTDSEANWGAYDSCLTLVSAHAITKIAIECAKILNVDQDKIEVWQEFLDNLTPLPTNKRKDAAKSLQTESADDEFWIWVPGESWPSPAIGLCNNPFIHMDMCNLETENADPEMFRIGANTFKKIAPTPEEIQKALTDLENDIGGQQRYGTDEMSTYSRIWAGMGRGDALLVCLIGQLKCLDAKDEHCWYYDNGCKAPYANRLTSREGVNAISAQRLGNAAAGLQMGLMQCSGGAPAVPGVIRIFPAWDLNHDAQFELWARDGFKVGAACKGGEITDFEITSTLGKECRVHNPFDSDMIVCDGEKETEYSGQTIVFNTEIGKVYSIKKA